MGLPELTFTLKKAAETVSTRISRGAVALILRDSKANGVHVVCQESDIPTTLGADNIAYIKRALMGYINRPSGVRLRCAGSRNDRGGLRRAGGLHLRLHRGPA